jgi:phosphoenolpyruvate carboxylase
MKACAKRIFTRLKAEWQASIDALLEITQETASCLTATRLLKRSISNRFPYIDPLNHLQVELLRPFSRRDYWMKKYSAAFI